MPLFRLLLLNGGYSRARDKEVRKMKMDEQSVSVEKLCYEIAKEINGYHKAAVERAESIDPITKKILGAYHKGVLASILIVKEKYTR